MLQSRQAYLGSLSGMVKDRAFGSVGRLFMAEAIDLTGHERGAALTKMKTIATVVLAAAALVFVLTFFVGGGGQVVLFVRAAAEAGMVGGLADWFAVTALFRYPLGLRIPHTALIPKKKDELAANLGGFVTGNFLTPGNVRTHLAEAALVGKAADWLSIETNAHRSAEIVASAAAEALGSLSPRTVAMFMLDFAELSARQNSPSKSVGRVLGEWIGDKRHNAVIESVLRHTQVQGRAHRNELADKLRNYVEGFGIIGWLSMSPGASRRSIDTALAELAAAEKDRRHLWRNILDKLLVQLATDLTTNPETSARLDGALFGWLRKRETRSQVEALSENVMDDLHTALLDHQSPTIKRLSEMLLDLARKLQSDPQLRAVFEEKLAEVVANLVQKHGGEVTEMIRKTVQGWSGEYASKQIELAAGKDLQFIRINGAIVGAIAGVLIHAISLVL